MKDCELKKSAVDDAVEAAGGRKELGEKVGVSREAVRLWVLSGVVPAPRVLAVEAATGVPRTRLNPSIYPS